MTLDDDDAHWLVGDTAPEAATATPASDDLAAARQRRLSAVGDELPLGDDAIEMVTGEESSATPEETTMELSETGLGAEQPMEAYLDEQRDEPGGEAPSEPVEPRRDPAAEAPAEPKPKPAKKRGRASVPSWDEIMFGGGKGD